MAQLEQADLDFHVGIAQAAHNDVMVHLIGSLISLISRQIQATPYSTEVIDQHRSARANIPCSSVGSAAAALRAYRHHHHQR